MQSSFLLLCSLSVLLTLASPLGQTEDNSALVTQYDQNHNDHCPYIYGDGSWRLLHTEINERYPVGYIRVHDKLFGEIYEGERDTEFLYPFKTYEDPFGDVCIDEREDRSSLADKARFLQMKASLAQYASNIAELRSTDVRAIGAIVSDEVAKISIERAEISLEKSKIAAEIDSIAEEKTEKSIKINDISKEIHDIKLEIDEHQAKILSLTKKSDSLTRAIDDIKHEVEKLTLKQQKLKSQSNNLSIKSDKLQLTSSKIGKVSSYLNIESSIMLRDKNFLEALEVFLKRQSSRFTDAANGNLRDDHFHDYTSDEDEDEDDHHSDHYTNAKKAEEPSSYGHTAGEKARNDKGVHS